MYKELKKINHRPNPYQECNAEPLWTDKYRASKMLEYHLNTDIDVSSRNIKFIDKSVNWIINEFSLGNNTKVCDFGCGPGLYTSRFAKAGSTVTGIDFSENSIDYAQTEAFRLGLDVQYICSNYLDVKFQDQYDLITLVMCDFCALSPSQRKTLLTTFDGMLSRKGKVLLDVYSLNAFDNKCETSFYEKNQLNHFWYKEDYYCFVNTFKYPEYNVILDKYSLFSENGTEETIYNWLQYYDLRSLKSEISEMGFSVISVYSDVCGNEFDPNHTEFAVVLQKSEN